MKKPSLWHATTLALLSLVTATAQAGITTRVSVDSAGVQGNASSGDYNHSTLSADGRYVAFESSATNLVLGDTNGTSDVFVHDRQTGTISRVSINNAGGQANGAASRPTLSADGRFVAFDSAASNLVPNDTNNVADLSVHDRITGSTTRVSVNSAGEQCNRASVFASLSADGRYVAFESEASDLVPNDTNGSLDIFVHDRLTGSTARVSVNSADGQGNSDSYYSTLSADSRYIAFYSLASNLVPGDTNDEGDIFVCDRLTGSTTRVSVSSTGVNKPALTFTPPSAPTDDMLPLTPLHPT
mgnify:CR=1 FL=1